jgi:hypothetical protein
MAYREIVDDQCKRRGEGGGIKRFGSGGGRQCVMGHCSHVSGTRLPPRGAAELFLGTAPQLVDPVARHWAKGLLDGLPQRE